MESHLKFPRDEGGTERVSKILAEAWIQLVNQQGGSSKEFLGGGFNVLKLHPYLGKWSKLTNSLQTGGSTTT